MDKTQGGARVNTKIDIGKILKLIIPKGLYVLAGYLSGACALPFGAYPFGFALLAASGKDAVFVYAGLVISCFTAFRGTATALFFGLYTAELLLRVLVRLTLDYPFGKGNRRPSREILASFFGEAAGYRLLSATVSVFSLCLCFLIGDGFLYYDLFGLLISVATAPLATYVFYCFFERKGVWRELGFLCLCAVCTYAASPLKLYGVSLAVFGGLFLIFFVTHRGGVIKGVLTSIVVGLVYSPILAPIFIFSALISGIFMKISPTLACFASFFASVAWGFYIKGIHALDGLFAGVLSACLLYAVFNRLDLTRQTVRETGAKSGNGAEAPCSVLDENELDGVRLLEMNRRMSAISDGLERLSSFFEQLNGRFPKRGELLRICEDAFESSCVGCPEYDRCRAQGRISGEIRRLSDLLDKNRRVSAHDVDSELARRCGRLPDILDEINYNSGARMSDRESGGEVFAPDYKALSRLLSRSMECESDEYKIDVELSTRLCPVLDSLKRDVEGIMVYGRRRRTVYIKAKSTNALRESKQEILDAIAPELPFPIDAEGTAIRRSANGGIMSVSEAETLEVSFVSRQVRAREETEFCGDSMKLFKNSDNRFFALISDGMGSGREAAAVSEICSNFICSMLDVGAMNDELICMLNGFLCGRCEGALCECSATVDIMELDLISGNTAFFKSGAAPSYVFRDGSLFKLRSCTMPIGILENTDTKKFSFKLSEGDVIVMMSDGVTGGKDECPWLFDLLRQNIESSGLERTADLILKYAVGHGSQDDISIAVMRVEHV